MDPRNDEFLKLEKDSRWSRAQIAQELELTEGAVSHFCTGRSAPSKTVLKLFRMLIGKPEPITLRDTGPSAEAESRRAEAAEAKLERAKKQLRAALAELEAEPSYRRTSSKPLSAVQEAAKKAGGG